MTPHYQDATVTLYAGDCLDVLAGLPDASVDAVVTDPPYALGFMGRKWDSFKGQPGGACEECGNDDPTEGYRLCSGCLEAADEADLRAAPMLGQQSQNWHAKATHSRGYADNNNTAFQRWCELWATECLRVLKPGGHLLAFGGTRTWHRLACAIEDAGFEIRDSIAWMYGSGFPKSLDVSKAIDKAAGADREDIGPNLAHHGGGTNSVYAQDEWTRENFAKMTRLTAPATPDAERWQGWGTALKPAHEPIVVARKPLSGTVAATVLAHGTGALNVDGCRIGDGGQLKWAEPRDMGYHGGSDSGSTEATNNPAGRWPANVILDESQATALDHMSGESVSPTGPVKQGGTVCYDVASGGSPRNGEGIGYADTGGASRFFYTPREDQPCTEETTAHFTNSATDADNAPRSTTPKTHRDGASTTGPHSTSALPIDQLDSRFTYTPKAGAGERVRYYRQSCECEDAWPTTSHERATAATTAPGSSSTSRSGSGTTGDPSPMGSRSTTSTETSSTTIPTTSSPSHLPTTSDSTPAASSATANGGSPADSAASSSTSGLPTGISAARDGRYTGDAGPVTLRAWSPTSVCGECGRPARRESHATVKPLALMRWLVRLVTPPGGVVLEPFAGSGTTAEACLLEGFRCIAIEREADYLPLIVQRINRRRDPVAAVLAEGEDSGLFDLLDEETA